MKSAAQKKSRVKRVKKEESDEEEVDLDLKLDSDLDSDDLDSDDEEIPATQEKNGIESDFPVK